jgi:hypothetical protein
VLEEVSKLLYIVHDGTKIRLNSLPALGREAYLLSDQAVQSQNELAIAIQAAEVLHVT